MLQCSFPFVAAQLFGANDFRAAEKANVAVQILQRNLPKIAAQLLFSQGRANHEVQIVN